jgi:hypothetical protein
VEDLRRAVKIEYLEAQGLNGEQEVSEEAAQLAAPEETSEKLDYRSHRKSLIGGVVGALDMIPQHAARSNPGDEEIPPPNDDFE